MSETQSTLPRAYAAAHFALELDGKDRKDIGLFRSIEGGGVRADSMSYASGGTYARYKGLGKPKFEDLKLQVGMAMSKPFYEWIEKFFKGVQERKDGEIVAADFYYVERARRKFTAALIKEIAFPKLDAADKNAAYMNVGLTIEDMTFEAPKGAQKLQGLQGFDQQKLWTSCNFAMTLDGYEAACSRITKVESFTVKQNIIEHNVGGMRATLKVPSSIEFPNLSFSLPAVDAEPLYKRFKLFGSDGQVPSPLAYGAKGSDATRIHGSIITKDNAGRDLFQIEFSGADIVNIAPDKLDAGTEEIAQVKVEMYVENMQFKYLQTA
jgi:phage tail-like protein